jgi:hypothetical protein
MTDARPTGHDHSGPKWSCSHCAHVYLDILERDAVELEHDVMEHELDRLSRLARRD